MLKQLEVHVKKLSENGYGPKCERIIKFWGKKSVTLGLTVSF